MIKRHFRSDSFEIQGYEFTANGYLVISGVVTRSGVFKYPEGGELRPREEVTKKESLDTIYAIPVTHNHPPDLVTLDNYQIYQKGFVTSKPTVKEADNEALVHLSGIIIQDSILMQDIIDKKISQFSLGYTCDLKEYKGNFDGDDYGLIQSNIVYNHLAIVRDARCGDVCEISTNNGDAMPKTYKADCACQDKNIRKDSDIKEEVDKKLEEKKEEGKEEGKKAEEVKKDEEVPAWVKSLMQQHAEMIALLKELKSGEKAEKEAEEKEDSDKNLYDEKSEEKEVEEKDCMTPTSRQDSKSGVSDVVSKFNFESHNSQSRDVYKPYRRAF